MAPDEVRVPDSLYNLGISAVIDNYQCFKNELRILPDNLMFDLYYKVRILFLQISACDSTPNVMRFDETFEIKKKGFCFSHLCAPLLIPICIYILATGNSWSD
jgi:hypothetical protein